MKLKNIRKNTQLKLTNPKNAGRKAIHDKGIRHIKREEIRRPMPLHLTIKLIKADIQNKIILKGLRHAIFRARLQGLRIIHYSLEHNHVHLYAECDNNITLGKAMKAFGVSFVKKVNSYFLRKGTCYKTRYHLRTLRSASEVKNVLNYILKNGMKHKRTSSVIDPYNSTVALHDFRILGMKLNQADNEISRKMQKDIRDLKEILCELVLYKRELVFV
jgi:hypothetical protein